MFAGVEFHFVFDISIAGGNPIDADSPPVVVIIKGGVDTVVSVVVSQLSDKSYIATFTPPSSWEEGDVVHGRISANAVVPLVSTAYIGEITLSADGLAKKADIDQAEAAIKKKITVSGLIGN